MEGKDDEFMFFNQSVADILESFPFNNTFIFQQEPENFNHFFIFPDMDYFNPLESSKNFLDGDQLLEKITKCEENYNNIIQYNLMSSPTANVKDKISENFESNLILAQGTLPGLIISIMHKENGPVSENFLLQELCPQYEDLRKLNGQRYNGDISKVLKSTLSSSGIFIKTVDGKFYFKEKEALDYIIKVTEKVLTKKLENSKVKPSNSSKNISKSPSCGDSKISKDSSKKKKKKNESFSSQLNYKICKVYNILDQMLSRCRGSIIMDKLNSKFKNANTSIELLQKIGDQNKLIGILMGFKYFKSMINKYAKLSSKKKKLESLIDLNKLNEKLDHLSQKMEALEKTITWRNSNSSSKTFSIASASTASVYAVHSATPHPYIDL